MRVPSVLPSRRGGRWGVLFFHRKVEVVCGQWRKPNSALPDFSEKTKSTSIAYHISQGRSSMTRRMPTAGGWWCVQSRCASSSPLSHPAKGLPVREALFCTRSSFCTLNPGSCTNKSVANRIPMLFAWMPVPQINVY